MGFVAALEMPRIELALGVMDPFHYVELSNMEKSSSLVAGLVPGGSSSWKIPMIGRFVEEYALPLKPFAFVDVVTSASTFTTGHVVTLTVAPVPPCEKAQLIVAANVGVGAKIGFPVLHHPITIEPFEASREIARKEYVAYKNGIKCIGGE
jgi:hypothetical protein